MANPTEQGQRFGKYQILDRVAVGGMAEIYRARLDGIGGFHRTFAIKRILPHLSSNPEFIEMLVDEAKVAGLLSHANIVQILDLGHVDQQFYVAMEYVNGRDLARVLQRCRDKGITLPVPHAVYVLLETLKGLEYAHNRQVLRGGRAVPLNVVHRDVSPANILLSFQGEVKLTDFGIAKASVKALETMSGVVKGRFDYMSPEQAAGLEVDQRSDLFSAGVVFYELLTGRHPFRQANEAATIDAVRRGEFEPPSYVNPDVPYSLDRVVEHALRVDRDGRFATATAFKDSLDRFFHDAGFIFSSSTLAAFLKGLFPEGDPRPASSKAEPVARPRADLLARPPDAARAAKVGDTVARLAAPSDAPRPPPPHLPARPRDDAPDDVQLEDESATSGAGRLRAPPDATLVDAAAVLRGASHEHTGRFGPIAGLGEESTLIRQSPSSPSAWSDAETVIRPDPTSASASLAPNLAQRVGPYDPTPPANRAPLLPPAAAPSADAPTRAAPAPRPSEAPRVESRRPPEPRAEERTPRGRTVVYRTPTLVHVVWLIAVVAMGLAGLAAGALLMRQRAVAVADAPPLLEVHLPTEGVVTVDGRALTGPSPGRVALTPGRAAVVRFARPGYPPTETRVELDANQLRVLTFDVAR